MEQEAYMYYKYSSKKFFFELLPLLKYFKINKFWMNALWRINDL